jgi:hypothetical protein
MIHALSAVLDGAEGMGGKTVFFYLTLDCREKLLGSPRTFSVDWRLLLPYLVSTKLCEYVCIELPSTASHSLVRFRL